MSRSLFCGSSFPSSRRGFQQELENAAALYVDPKEKTPLAKTVRTCRQILKVEPALWTFVNHPLPVPTNNAAEQALRPAVIWRRLSFGSKSQGGSDFVARMLTRDHLFQAQNRSVLDFLTQPVALLDLVLSLLLFFPVFPFSPFFFTPE